MEYIELRQRRDFSGVISTGFQFIRLNWKTLYRPLIFICIPLNIIASLFFGNFFRTMMESSQSGNVAAILGSMGAMSVGYLLIAVSMLLMYTMVYEYMRHYLLNHGLAPTVGELWKATSSQLPAYFLIGFLAGIIAVFGIILFFVGAVWLAVVFTMSFPLRAFERASIGDCIGRSFKLIKGHWWETFGLVLVLAMLIGFISYFIYLPMLLLTGFGTMSGMEEMGDPSGAGHSIGIIMTVFMLVNGIVNILLQPFLLVPLGLQALSLLEEKEGRGLLERVEEAIAPPVP